MPRKLSEAHKAKLREARMGEKNPFYGKKHSEEFKKSQRQRYSGEGNPFFGRKHTDETIRKISEARVGLTAGELNPMYGKQRTPEEKAKISSTRVEHGVAKGANNPNWQGGISEERAGAMQTTAYRQWRQVVFTRDNYTCQHCNKRGGDLEADHIKPWAFFPELRYDVNNGRTLCVNCHKKTFKDLAKYRAMRKDDNVVD